MAIFSATELKKRRVPLVSNVEYREKNEKRGITQTCNSQMSCSISKDIFCVVVYGGGECYKNLGKKWPTINFHLYTISGLLFVFVYWQHDIFAIYVCNSVVG